MPNVDFYLLSAPSKQDTYRFLCRLVEKAYQQHYHAYIHTSSLEEAQCLDNLLWTFRDISFIPHQVGETNSTLLSPSILIGTDKPKLHTLDILFNLTQDAPSFFSEFSRIIEVVSEEKNDKIQARKKYKVYKEQNCPLATHNINLAC